MTKRSSADTEPGNLLAYFQLAEQLNGWLRDHPAGGDPLAMLYVRAWLGALGALLQGWKVVGASHPIVSPLLGARSAGSEGKRMFADLLAVAGKDVFQYSGARSPPTVAAFVTTPGALEWAGTLHRAFRAFFEERPARGAR